MKAAPRKYLAAGVLVLAAALTVPHISPAHSAGPTHLVTTAKLKAGDLAPAFPAAVTVPPDPVAVVPAPLPASTASEWQAPTTTTTTAPAPAAVTVTPAAPVVVSSGGSGWPNSCYGQTDPNALYVISIESSCNLLAQNPSSTAFGIYQMLTETSTDPAVQTADGNAYANSRYGGWAGAAAHERAYNWY